MNRRLMLPRKTGTPYPVVACKGHPALQHDLWFRDTAPWTQAKREIEHVGQEWPFSLLRAELLGLQPQGKGRKKVGAIPMTGAGTKTPPATIPTIDQGVKDLSGGQIRRPRPPHPRTGQLNQAVDSTLV